VNILTYIIQTECCITVGHKTIVGKMDSTGTKLANETQRDVDDALVLGTYFFVNDNDRVRREVISISVSTGPFTHKLR